VEELWNTPTPDGIERYYEGLLYLMALLHAAANLECGKSRRTGWVE